MSCIVGVFAGIFIGIGFVFALILRIVRYLAGDLIGLLIPSLKYQIKTKRMLRDTDDKKEPVLRTGVFGKVELKGSGCDTNFRIMRECMEKYQKQKERRANLKDAAMLKESFKQADRLYQGFLKQFYLAAKYMNWKKADIYHFQDDPSYPLLKKACSGMQTLIERQDQMINSGFAASMPDIGLLDDLVLEQGAEIETDASQQTQQMQD